MKRKVSFLTALVLVLSALLVPAMANAAEAVKIGVIAPMSGSLATYGESTTNGIKLAIDEINQAGGVLDGRPLEVIAYMDDKGDSTEGANSFNKLVADGAKAIIGSVTSGVTAGLADALDQARGGGCRGLMHRQRQMMPLPGDLGMLVDPAFEHGEVRAAERAFEVGVFDHRETRIRPAVAPGRPCRRR